MIQIQATITGYSGQACTLFSAYDPESRVLVVGAETNYRTERREGCAVITNIPDLPRDMLVGDVNLLPSIRAFYDLKTGIAADGRSTRLVFSDRAVRANPDAVIECDGIDASGPKYRVADGVTCGQIAALSTCLYAIRSGTVTNTVKMAQRLNALLSGDILTI